MLQLILITSIRDFATFNTWDYHFCEPTDRSSDAEFREELDRLFQQAVNRQLVTDVELGSYLSGGMDSGAITAIAAKSFPYLKTFTCGFDLSSASGIELGFDERVKAEAMSYHFKTEHYEMVLKAGDMERADAQNGLSLWKNPAWVKAIQIIMQLNSRVNLSRLF
jgi:asparagine synthetase B (glutamine-hydrolysing)